MLTPPPLHPWYDVADHAPNLPLLRPDGRPKPPSRMAGRLAALHLPGDRNAEEMATAIRDRLAEYRAAGADPYLIRRAAPVKNLALTKKQDLDFEVLADEDGALAHNLELRDGGTALLGPDTRIVDVLPFEAGEPCAAHLDRVVCRIQTAAGPGFSPVVARHAPVMVVPGVLPPDWCRYLMAVHDQQGNEPSGFMQQVKGETVMLQDPEVKVRRDHVIKPGTDLDAAITHMFQRRLIPEIQKATHARISRHEEFKVVRYDAAEGGHFRAHRDNTTQATRTRLFAVTLNLNTAGPDGDYDGGHLVFPEYGEVAYRPAPGDALVFSCTLLHEARAVTAGSRYVLLAFLH